MYYLCYNAYLREGKEVDFSLYDINDLISDDKRWCWWRVLEHFKVAFNESMTKNVPVTGR
jgi:hypothetical protein